MDAILAISGGKDSTALAHWLHNNPDIDKVYAFMLKLDDTWESGWEVIKQLEKEGILTTTEASLYPQGNSTLFMPMEIDTEPQDSINAIRPRRTLIRLLAASYGRSLGIHNIYTGIRDGGFSTPEFIEYEKQFTKDLARHFRIAGKFRAYVSEPVFHEPLIGMSVKEAIDFTSATKEIIAKAVPCNHHEILQSDCAKCNAHYEWLANL